MNVEISKAANGYMVYPTSARDYGRAPIETIYLFRTYAEMIDKLQEILEAPEPKHQ